MAYPQLFDSGLFKDASPVTKLFLAVFITISSFLILGFAFILLAMPIFNLSFAEINVILKETLPEGNISFIKYFQLTQSIALFVVPSILLNYLLFTGKNNFLRNRVPSFKHFFLVILLIVLAVPIIEELVKWNKMIHFPGGLEEKFLQLENEASEITDKLLGGKSVIDLLINIFIVAIIPAIGEEFIFRGVLQRIFNDWLKNAHFAIILSAILFSSIHLQFYGFIPRMMLGILFGYIYFWSNNIWLAVLGHFINNFIAVFIQYLSSNNINFWLSSDKNNETSGIIILLVSVAIVVVIIYYLRILSQKTLIKLQK